LKITVDTDVGTVFVEDGNQTSTHNLDTAEAFEAISQVYLRCGWDTKYVYSFSWMGRPIIQLPDDMVRIQELIYSVKPDVIIETGIAHGGSLIFYSGILKAMGRGKVVGVDIDIRAHNREAIEAHEMFPLITLIEGDSIANETMRKVQEQVSHDDTVLVLLDGNHSKNHVAQELELYSPLVSVGSYIVATDGIMQDLVGAPRSQSDWADNNPASAAREFVLSNPSFIIEEPTPVFNEGEVEKMVTYWPDGYIKRIR
jgi:cephalosporin hydroxylase